MIERQEVVEVTNSPYVLLKVNQQTQFYQRHVLVYLSFVQCQIQFCNAFSSEKSCRPQRTS
jgi:hypothetical protein